MNRSLLMLALALTCACGERKEQPAPETSKPQAYFPVKDFLQGEISAVDSLPVGLMQYHSSANQSDSGYIDRERFHALAAEFIPESLDDSAFRQHFQETAFIDKSTGAATFFYGAKNIDQGLRRVDVVTAKTDTYDRVKSVYLEKSRDAGDSLVVKKLFWKPGRNFQIITQVTKKSGDPETELLKVVWDNRE